MVFGDFDQIADKTNFLSKCSIKYAPTTCVGKLNTPTNLQNIKSEIFQQKADYSYLEMLLQCKLLRTG